MRQDETKIIVQFICGQLTMIISRGGAAQTSLMLTAGRGPRPSQIVFQTKVLFDHEKTFLYFYIDSLSMYVCRCTVYSTDS